MEIKPSNSYSQIPPAEARPVRRAVQETTEGGEFAGTAALQRALDATPDVRPEAVARGQALAKSDQYPPAETMQRLARLFALEFGAQKTPSSTPN
jgi:hypothetical protein